MRCERLRAKNLLFRTPRPLFRLLRLPIHSIFHSGSRTFLLGYSVIGSDFIHASETLTLALTCDAREGTR